MTLNFTPEEMDALMARVNLTFTKRMLAAMAEVPMENRNELMTDAGHRERVTSALMARIEKEHPMPDWRDLIWRPLV